MDKRRIRDWAKFKDESSHSAGVLNLSQGVTPAALRGPGNLSSGRLHLKFKQ